MYVLYQTERRKKNVVHKWTKYVQMLLIPTIDIHFYHIGKHMWIAWNQQHIFHHSTFSVYKTKFFLAPNHFHCYCKSDNGFALLWHYNFLIPDHLTQQKKKKTVQLFFFFFFCPYNKECSFFYGKFHTVFPVDCTQHYGLYSQSFISSSLVCIYICIYVYVS